MDKIRCDLTDKDIVLFDREMLKDVNIYHGLAAEGKDLVVQWNEHGHGSIVSYRGKWYMAYHTISQCNKFMQIHICQIDGNLRPISPSFTLDFDNANEYGWCLEYKEKYSGQLSRLRQRDPILVVSDDVLYVVFNDGCKQGYASLLVKWRGSELVDITVGVDYYWSLPDHLLRYLPAENCILGDVHGFIQQSNSLYVLFRSVLDPLDYPVLYSREPVNLTGLLKTDTGYILSLDIPGKGIGTLRISQMLLDHHKTMLFFRRKS